MIRPSLPRHWPAFTAAPTSQRAAATRYPRATTDESASSAQHAEMTRQRGDQPSTRPIRDAAPSQQHASSGAISLPASSTPPTPLLLGIEEAPAWTRDKSGSMRSGYRPRMSAGECVRSLWYPHNQSGSVWTFVAKLGISTATCFELCGSLAATAPADALGAGGGALAAVVATAGTAGIPSASTATSAAAAAAPLLLLLVADFIHTPASIAFHLFQPVSPELKVRDPTGAHTPKTLRSP